MQQFLIEQDSIQRAYLRHWNFSNPEYATTFLHIVGDIEDGREAYLAALEAVETIQEYDVTPVDDRSFYVYIRETPQSFASRLRVLLTDTELLIVPSIEYGTDGEILFEVAGEQDALQGLIANLPDHLSVGQPARRVRRISGVTSHSANRPAGRDARTRTGTWVLRYSSPSERSRYYR